VPLGLRLVAKREEKGIAWSDPQSRASLVYSYFGGTTLEANYQSVLDKVLSEGGRVHGSLAAPEKERVDLFPMIQRLALEIAGRTMFSPEMGQHGPELREQIMRYGQRLRCHHLLDFVVPVGIPTPYDWARA
jgi:hypothetical protein